MNHSLVFELIIVSTSTAMVAESGPPDRVDPLFDCSTPTLDADTPDKAKLLRVQYGVDGLVRKLRETYAGRLAGLFRDQKVGEDSRLVLRLTGDEPFASRGLTVCSEPLTVELISGQMHTREELEKLPSNNLEWFRGKFPGLQGTYADERAGEIVLEIHIVEAGGTDVEALRQEAQSRLGAPLRVDMTTEKLVPAILNRAS